MNKNIQELQEILRKTWIGADKLDEDLDLLQMEVEYQALISQYSTAYRSGSSWYVGPSLIEHIKQGSLAPGLLNSLFFLSYKLDKKK